MKTESKIYLGTALVTAAVMFPLMRYKYRNIEAERLLESPAIIWQDEDGTWCVRVKRAGGYSNLIQQTNLATVQDWVEGRQKTDLLGYGWWLKEGKR